jgi:hypothetical protein
MYSAFAPASDVEPYFSRRIGLAAGLPVPLHVGARLTGQVGRTDVGLLQVRTGGALLPGQRHVRSEDFTVARARHRILQESTFGLIYTRRASHASDFDHSDHTLGADLELGTSRFLGDRNLQFQAFLVWHNDPYIIDTTNVLSRSVAREHGSAVCALPIRMTRGTGTFLTASSGSSSIRQSASRAAADSSGCSQGSVTALRLSRAPSSAM